MGHAPPTPAEATCKHCALKIKRGGKGRDTNTWVHVDGEFRLCESESTSATPA